MVSRTFRQESSARHRSGCERGEE